MSSNTNKPDALTGFGRKQRIARKGFGVEKIVIELNDGNVIPVPGWYLTDLYVSRGGESFSIMSDVCTYRYPQPGDVFAVIAGEFDGPYVPLFNRRGAKRQTIFERIKEGKDVASVRIFLERSYANEEMISDLYRAPWESEKGDDSRNALQTCYENVLGDLIVAVGQSDLLKLLALEAAKEDGRAVKLKHRKRAIGVPFDPEHDLRENGEDLPQEGRTVLVRENPASDPVRAVRNGEIWQSETGEPLPFKPLFWQYERKLDN